MQDYIGRILYDESKGRGVCKNVWCLWNREDPNGQLEREYAWRVKWDSSNHDVVLTTKEVAAVDTGNIDLSPALLPEVRAMARAAAEGGKRMVGPWGWQCFDDRCAAKCWQRLQPASQNELICGLGWCAGGSAAIGPS